MRKIAILTAALALVAIPQGASAQNLGGILRTVTGVGYSSGNNCGYTTGINSVVCQANRAQSMLSQVDRLRREREQRRFEEMNRLRTEMSRQDRLNRALENACRAGDQESCGRSTGVGSSKLASALMEACSAGDQRSCDRVRAMRDGRYADDRGYAQVDARIDPRTGYRIAR